MQAILTLGDKDLDGRMDLNEFVQFVTEQERKLWEIFSSLDANGDGMSLYPDALTILLTQLLCILATKSLHQNWFTCKKHSIWLWWPCRRT